MLALHTLKSKPLVKHFLFGVNPQKLATSLGYSEFENIYEAMNEFISVYKVLVKARKNLAEMDVLAGEKSSVKKLKAETSQKEAKAVAATTWSTTAATSASGQRSDRSSSSARATSTRRECWECKSKDHMRNECPIWKNKKGTSQIGAIMHMTPDRKGPYLVVEVTSSNEMQPGGDITRTQGFFDSGSDINAIGENMVSNLELISGQVKELAKPMEVRWLDNKVTRMVTKCMELQVSVIGTDVKCILPFLLCRGIWTRWSLAGRLSNALN